MAQKASTTPKLRFIHLRFWNGTGILAPDGGYTIAYVPTSSHVHVAYSRCSLRDNFNKKVGRNIAAGRMQSGNYYNIPLPKDTDEIFEKVCAFVTKHDLLRNRSHADLQVENQD